MNDQLHQTNMNNQKAASEVNAEDNCRMCSGTDTRILLGTYKCSMKTKK